MNSSKANNSKKYKSVVAENKARKHYRKNVKKLRDALIEYDLEYITCHPEDNRNLYWLCKEVWDYKEDGFMLPLLEFGIELEASKNEFTVSLG